MEGREGERNGSEGGRRKGEEEGMEERGREGMEGISLCFPPTCRAKSIKNTASVNKDMSQKALLSAYQKEIQQLKDQLSRR